MRNRGGGAHDSGARKQGRLLLRSEVAGDLGIARQATRIRRVDAERDAGERVSCGSGVLESSPSLGAQRERLFAVGETDSH